MTGRKKVTANDPGSPMGTVLRSASQLPPEEVRGFDA